MKPTKMKTTKQQHLFSLRSRMINQEVKTKLTRGQTVKIYQNPLTLEDYEGEAKLIRFVDNDFGEETWMVRFEGEQETYRRRIKV